MTYSDEPGPNSWSPDAAVPDPDRERLLREEADALRKSRPAEINTAFLLWIAAIVVSAISEVLDVVGGIRNGQAPNVALGAVLFLIKTALWLFFVFSMRAGQNWARIVMTVITGLYAILAVLAVVAVSVLPAAIMPAQSGGVSLVLMLLLVVITVTAVAVMFRSRASDYFEGA